VTITRFDRFPTTYGFALGTPGSDPEVYGVCHVFTKFKAFWLDMADDLPQIDRMGTTTSSKAKICKPSYPQAARAGGN
jgi:hypothetical protein